MSTLTVEPTLFDRPGGEPSLDELISGVWEVLAARQPVDCPVCGGDMQPWYGAHSRQPDDSGAARPSRGRMPSARAPEGGRCGDCGSSLS
jgi:hypothetical protein